jgi:transposase
VQQAYRDVPSHGRPVTLRVTRQRYRCRDCSRTLFEPVSDLDDQRFATRRLVEFVTAESFRRPFLPVAEAVGLDEKTVRNIFGDYVEHLRTTIKFETPEVLGIDELKIIGEYRCMLTNVDKRTIFDLIPNRRLTNLMPYFRTFPDKDKVKWVTMDMWQPYRQAVKKHVPNATIVVNRFHIHTAHRKQRTRADSQTGPPIVNPASAAQAQE